MHRICKRAEAHTGLRTALFPRDYRYATHTCNCTGRAVERVVTLGVSAIVPALCRAAGSDSGSAWLNEKLLGLHIRDHRGVLVMQNSQHKLNSSRRREFVFYGINCRPSRRRENVWRDVWGIKVVLSARLADEDLFLAALLGETGRDSEYVIAKLASVCYGETRLEFISGTPWFPPFRGFWSFTFVLFVKG
jgi:hypothetical protein